MSIREQFKTGGAHLTRLITAHNTENKGQRGGTHTHSITGTCTWMFHTNGFKKACYFTKKNKSIRLFIRLQLHLML